MIWEIQQKNNKHLYYALYQIICHDHEPLPEVTCLTLFFQKLEGQHAGRSLAGSGEASSQRAVSYLCNTHLPAVWAVGWSAQRRGEALLPPAASLRTPHLQVLVSLGASVRDQWSQEGCCSACSLLSPQPSWQRRSLQPSLGTEKIQEGDPLFLLLHLSPCFWLLCCILSSMHCLLHFCCFGSSVSSPNFS